MISNYADASVEEEFILDSTDFGKYAANLWNELPGFWQDDHVNIYSGTNLLNDGVQVEKEQVYAK